MAAIALQPYVTLTIPAKEFNLVEPLAKRFKWLITSATAKKTGMEKAFDDVKYGRVSVLHTPKNWKK